MDFFPLHSLPKITEKWGYDHIPDVYQKVDPQWDQITGNGSFVAGLLKLVSNSKGGGKFSRGPDSWISLDTVSVGIAHWWAGTLPNLFSKFAQEKPALCVWAWGDKPAELMKDPNFLKEHLQAKRGKYPHNNKFNWLLSGWYEISRHPEIIGICCREWLESYVPPSNIIMEKYHWKKGTTKAGLIRLTNSRGSKGMFSLIDKGIKELKSKAEDKVMPFVYETLYEKPDRWKSILSAKEFKKPFENSQGQSLLTVKELDFMSPEVVRTDGSKPGFLTEGHLLVCSPQ